MINNVTNTGKLITLLVHLLNLSEITNTDTRNNGWYWLIHIITNNKSWPIEHDCQMVKD